eukprot:708877-Amphidinium_carterae.1
MTWIATFSVIECNVWLVPACARLRHRRCLAICKESCEVGCYSSLWDAWGVFIVKLEAGSCSVNLRSCTL